MQALEIKLFMMTPLALPFRKRSFPLHLDALLIRILADRRGQPFDGLIKPEFDDWFAPENVSENKVPLAVAGDARPVYMASAAFPSEFKMFNYVWTRKSPDPETYMMAASAPGRKNAIEKRKAALYVQGGAGSGPNKGWMETSQCIACDTLTFYCTGDMDAIEDLLLDVDGIGTKRNIGMGEVYNFKIKEIDQEQCGLILPDGTPARALPIRDWSGKDGWFQDRMTTRAPYYNGLPELCWAPNPKTVYPGRY